MKIKSVCLILFLMQALETYSQTEVMVKEGRRWSIMITATGLEPSLLPSIDTKTSIL